MAAPRHPPRIVESFLMRAQVSCLQASTAEAACCVSRPPALGRAVDGWCPLGLLPSWPPQSTPKLEAYYFLPSFLRRAVGDGEGELAGLLLLDGCFVPLKWV